jgi:hypothetical protein
MIVKHVLIIIFKVDLEAMVQITAIATQGRAGYGEWVTSYKMAYSQDGSKFYMYSAFQRDAVVKYIVFHFLK